MVNLSKLLKKFKERYAPKFFFSTILCFVALLQLIFCFRKAVLRKLFDIWFSYKHCNFSHVCLLVKMASKTVTKSIHKHARRFFWRNFLDLSCQLLRSLSFFRTTLVKCLQPTRLPRVLLWCRYSISLVWCRQLPNSQTLIKFASTLPLDTYVNKRASLNVSLTIVNSSLLHGIH